jgi:hypothetical protein
MTAETFARPGWLGRGVRLATGTGLLVLCLVTLTDYAAYVGGGLPHGLSRWLGIALCGYFLSEGGNHGGVVNRGFARAWGRWPQLIVVLSAIMAIFYNLIRSGSWWGTPLGILNFVLVVYYTGHLGLSFVLASILAHPG